MSKAMEHNQDEDDFIRRKTTFGEIEEILDDVEIYFMKVKNFDTLQYPPSDHYFLNSNIGCPSLDQLFKGSLIKKLKEEWNVLNAHTPSNIFIRVYETSIEVIRVAIVAENESSYHHGLLFFDIRFPKSYPSKPPQLFYHSFGDSQFPKTLHQDGTVVLDLSRKWSALKSNVAEPGKSAILELLVHIQQVILTSTTTNPSLNTTKQPLRVYDKKRALVKTCGAMLSMMRLPPEGFEAFVAGYYRTRAHRILLNFRSSVDISADSDMKVWFFRLVKAFEKNGTYCKHHYTQQQYDQAFQEERSYDNPVKESKKGRF